jgi:hypothetical protein
MLEVQGDIIIAAVCIKTLELLDEWVNPLKASQCSCYPSFGYLECIALCDHGRRIVNEPTNSMLALIRWEYPVISSTAIQGNSGNSRTEFNEITIMDSDRGQGENVVQFS